MSSMKLFNRRIFKLASLFSTNTSQSKQRVNVQVTIPPVVDNDSPVVLVLGWLGSQDKHLKKYSKIYEDRGLVTLRYTAPVSALFFRPSKMWGITRGILDTIDENRLGERPILVHTFSNGGAYCFRYLLSMIRSMKRPVEIRGQILDSGPCATRLAPFYNVLKVIFGEDKFYSPFLAGMGIIGVIVLRLVQYPFYGFSYLIDPKNWFDYEPYRALIKDPLIFPMLFLYSKEDKLMPYKDVEQFANTRESLGAKVTVRCFDGSAHVSHFLKYPKEYTSAIDEFLNSNSCKPKSK